MSTDFIVSKQSLINAGVRFQKERNGTDEEIFEAEEYLLKLQWDDEASEYLIYDGQGRLDWLRSEGLFAYFPGYCPEPLFEGEGDFSRRVYEDDDGTVSINAGSLSPFAVFFRDFAEKAGIEYWEPSEF